MALFVAAPDLSRLVRVMLNQPTRPRDVESLFRSGRLTSLGAPALAAVLVYHPLASMLPDLPGGRQPPVPSLYGIFEVDSVARNGLAVPPLLTDATRWRRIVFERNEWAALMLVSDSLLLFRSEIDTSAKMIQLTTRQRTVGLPMTGRVDTLRLAYARPDEAHIRLRGLVAGDSTVLWMHQVPAERYRLLNARHRWAW
jgi:hypothetical protein